MKIGPVVRVPVVTSNLVIHCQPRFAAKDFKICCSRSLICKAEVTSGGRIEGEYGTSVMPGKDETTAKDHENGAGQNSDSKASDPESSKPDVTSGGRIEGNYRTSAMPGKDDTTAVDHGNVSQMTDETKIEEGYDVYVNEPQLLSADEEKHLISVFVADESGMINRVAGVFARRGANIESLAVGLNNDRALFTIVVTGTRNTVEKLVKQLAKLVKVRYVEDITYQNRVERELVLMKVRAPPGAARTEIMQNLDIFRARCVDVADNSLTLCCSGDAGKTLAFQKAMQRFGVIQMARTGKISLKRGASLLEEAGWTERPHAARRNRSAATVDDSSYQEAGADVYAVDSNQTGVWQVENVLDDQDEPESATQYEPQTLNIEVVDVPGVLNEITGVFARRGYNIQSLAVGPSERDGMSRIVTVIPGNAESTSKIIKQLYKLVSVQSVTDLSEVPFTSQELMLVKVQCSASMRAEITALANIFHGNICDVSLDTVTVELRGKEAKMKAMQSLLQPYGILEVARTGRVALERDSRVNTKYINRMKEARW